MAISVELRMPPATLARSVSQSRRVVRSTSTGTPRSASSRSRVSSGTMPWLQPEPSKLG